MTDLNTLDLNFAPNKPKGGTELQLEYLKQALPDLCEQVQIILSRPEQVTHEDKPRVLWLQDLPHDPASQCLKDKTYRTKFNKLVFVSHWQREQYKIFTGIPYSEGVVIKNGIPIIPLTLPKPRDDGKLRFIYTPTPHRGLGVLAAAAEELQKHRQDWHLDVFSSLKIYGRHEMDAQFEPLYEQLKRNPCVTYHGSVPYPDVRKAVNNAHVFVYPSIYQESSPAATIEALASGCLVITSSFGPLPEICSEWSWMMPYDEDINVMANGTLSAMYSALDNYDNPGLQRHLEWQSSYYQHHFNFKNRIPEWKAVLEMAIAEGVPQQKLVFDLGGR